MKISRTTEAIRFDNGISVAEYAEGEVGYSAKNKMEQGLLPGSTTVSDALADVFPEGQGIAGEIMGALVAGNPAYLRTSAGFTEVAKDTIGVLREKKSETAERAAYELEQLLADSELCEMYRASLLET
jgi:hypothetical protein